MESPQIWGEICQFENFSNGQEMDKSEAQYNYFQFTSEEFFNDFLLFFEETISEDLEQAQNLTKNLVKNAPLEEQFDALRQLYINRAMGPLHKFKELCEKIFALPENVSLLGNLEVAVVTAEECERTHSKVLELQKEYTEELQYQKRLNEECKKIEKLEPLLEKTENWLNFFKQNEGLEHVEELFKQLESAEKYLYSVRCNDEDVEDATVENIFLTD